MKKLIIFLIRMKLGLKKYEQFRFENQNQFNEDIYYFSEDKLIKIVKGSFYKNSRVSLNWLLDSECRVVKLGVKTHEKP